MNLFRLMRPHQWTKNLLCLAGIAFSGHLFEFEMVELALLTVAVFSAGSSSIYILNDIVDREYDRKHRLKCARPVASGAVSVPLATALGVVLAIGALVGAFGLNLPTLSCLVLYMVNNLAYSLYMKRLALVDVLSIAFGFVMRLLAGVYAIGEVPTTWIVLCTFFLAMFLGFAKRRAELSSLADEEQLQRPVLKKYSIPYLDSLISGSSMMVIICYALFTILSGKNPSLVITLPIVYYSIMHYQRLVMVGKVGEEPDRILLKDGLIKLALLLWFFTYFGFIYLDIQLFR